MRFQIQRHATPCAWILLAWTSLSHPAEPRPQAHPDPRAGLSKELQDYLRLPERALDLGQGALLISREEHPELDVAAKLKVLDALGERLTSALTKAGTPRERLDALKRLLFEEERYRLPEKDDAAAFLLSDVLELKRGNCLGLSVLCLALAERAGLGGKLFGVPIPSRRSGAGHLLVRYSDGTAAINFDAVEQGAEHPNAHYEKLFELKPADLQGGYILGNASKKDVLNLLLVNLGGARVEAGQALKARPILELAVLCKPEYAPAHVNLGAACFSLGDLEGAARAFKRALELDSGSVGGRLGLAGVCLRLGQVERAEEEAMTVEALEPENAQAKSLLANVHLARGEFRAARVALAAVVRSAPKDQQARCNLGTACRLGGEFAEAEQVFREALGLDPQYADARYGLGEVLRSMGRAKEAADEFAAALKLDPGHVPTQLALAQTARQSGDLRAASAAYECILKKQPFNQEALNGLVEVWNADGKSAQAVKRLAQVVKEHPGQVGLILLLGDAKLKAGDATGALATFQGALKGATSGDQILLLQRIAIAHGKMQNHRAALEVAEQLLKLNPKDLAALRVAGAASETLRQGPKAIDFYKRILALDSTDVQAKKALQRLGIK